MAGEIDNKGEKGDVGAAGHIGETGHKGDRGDIGDSGDQGLRGDMGHRGYRGDRGESGSDGETVLRLSLGTIIFALTLIGGVIAAHFMGIAEANSHADMGDAQIQSKYDAKLDSIAQQLSVLSDNISYIKGKLGNKNNDSSNGIPSSGLANLPMQSQPLIPLEQGDNKQILNSDTENGIPTS